ncbi:hypothetical protein PENTCL1PPCAC_27449, partial [Pristionchus entomophagus]
SILNGVGPPSIMKQRHSRVDPMIVRSSPRYSTSRLVGVHTSSPNLNRRMKKSRVLFPCITIPLLHLPDSERRLSSGLYWKWNGWERGVH